MYGFVPLIATAQPRGPFVAAVRPPAGKTRIDGVVPIAHIVELATPPAGGWVYDGAVPIVDEIAVVQPPAGNFSWTGVMPTVEEVVTATETHFRDTTVGTQPTGWTERWQTDQAWNVEEARGSTHALHLPAVTGLYAFSLDDLDATADIELLAFMLNPGLSGDRSQLIVRGGGSTGSEDGYVLRANADDLLLGKYVGGTWTQLDSSLNHPAISASYDERHFVVRFRANSTTLQGRIWRLGEDEPSTWDVEATSQSDHASGWAGYMTSGSADSYSDRFAWATGGSTAEFAYPDDPTTSLSTDFSEYTAAQAPADWSEPWHPIDDDYQVIGSTGTIGDKYLQMKRTTDDRALAEWDDVGETTWVDSLALLSSTTESGWPSGAAALTAGDGTAEDGALAWVRATDRLDTEVYYGGLLAGGSEVQRSWAANEWWYARARASSRLDLTDDPAAGALLAKAWKKGDPEPFLWHTVQMHGRLASGKAGIINYESGNTHRADWYAASFDGSKAPLPSSDDHDASTLVRTTAGLLKVRWNPWVIATDGLNDECLEAWFTRRQWSQQGTWTFSGYFQGPGRLRCTTANDGDYSIDEDVSAGELFVFAVIRTTSSAGSTVPAILARADSTAQNGYYVYQDPVTDQYGLKKIVGGTVSTVGGPHSPAAGWNGTDYKAVALWVKDGAQEYRFDAEAVQSATDTAHDAQNSRSAGFYVDAASAQGDDLEAQYLVVCAGKNVVGQNLPTGYKLKLLDAAETVVASATESSGTATIDCMSVDIPEGGLIAIVTNSSDVEQKRFQRYDGGSYPGDVFDYAA